jgi:cysteine-rich repeat protein
MLSVHNCQLPGTGCPAKTVTFDISFRDPRAAYVARFTPSLAYTDGLTPMDLEIEGFPLSANESDVSVSLGMAGLATLVTISRPSTVTSYGPGTSGTSDAIVSCLVPAGSASTVDPVLLIKQTDGATVSVPFPGRFNYLTPPSPVVASAVPSYADLSVETPVVLHVSMFPGIQEETDIVVILRWPDGATARAKVVSYRRTVASKAPQEVQDVEIRISSPVVGDVKEGNVEVTVYNVRKADRVATFSGFRIVDAAMPSVSGISTEESLTGRQSIRVRSSSATQVTLFASNSKSAIADIMIGDRKMDLILSQHSLSTRTVKAMWLQPAKSSAANSFFGLVRFGDSCGVECTTACCATGDCTICTCQTACFNLAYYDDLQPSITFLSAAKGPGTGGTEIILKVSRLPVVTSGTDVSVTLDGGAAFAESAVMTSSPLETSLVIFTPEMDTMGVGSRQVTFTLFSKVRPDKAVSFVFTYEAVLPVIQSTLPSVGSSSGGSLLTVSISNFPLGEVLGVSVGQATIPQRDITVLPASNKLLTVISFKQPTISPGIHVLRVFPVDDPFSTKATSLPNFLVTDPTSLTLLQPSTKSGPFEPSANTPNGVLRVGNYPSYAMGSPTLLFPLGPLSSDGTVSATILSVVASATDSTAEITFVPPSAPSPYASSVGTLTLPALAGGGASKLLSVPYEFFDGAATRVSSISPSLLPVRLSIYGKVIEFDTVVTAVLANFDQSMPADEVSIIVGSATEAAVLSVQHESICSVGPSCNTTTVRFRAPAVDTPVELPIVFAGRGKLAATSVVSFFSICDYESFCGEQLLTADTKVVQDSSPTSNLCEWRPGGREVCLSPDLLPSPSLVSITPTLGPASGGTLVTVVYDNLPAFHLEDVTVVAGSGGGQVFGLASSVSPQDGSTMMRNGGIITFLSPRVPEGDTGILQTVPMSLVAAWGEVKQQLSFDFEYTPVIKGPAVPVSVYPIMLPPSSTLIRVTVQLSNFPVVTSASDVLASFSNASAAPIISSSILSSSYESTSAVFLINTTLLNASATSAILSVYYAPNGPAAAASFQLGIDTPRAAAITAVFPGQGVMGSPQRLRLTLSAFPPFLGASGFSLAALLPVPVAYTYVSGGGEAMTDEYPLQLESLRAQYPASCKTRSCTRYVLDTTIPVAAMPDAFLQAGMSVNLSVTSTSSDAGGQVFTAQRGFSLSPASLPRLTSASPTATRLDRVQLTPLTLILNNTNDAFCASASQCSASVGGLPASFLSTHRSGSVQTLKIQPVPGNVAGAKSGFVSSGGLSLPFSVMHSSPPASVAPVDGPCAGGGIITITAIGFGAVVSDAGDISVTLGQSFATSVTITASSQTQTVITANAPRQGLAGAIKGKVTYGSKVLEFDWECFDSPSMAISPSGSPLSGLDDLGAAAVVTVLLSHFPRVTSTRDVQVSFGSLLCRGAGTGCTVISFTNLPPSSVSLNVTVPSSTFAGSVDLGVTFIGRPAPPVGGDAAASYVRTPKSASSKFRYFVPAPVVAAALWCSQCTQGPSGTPCIVAGLCGGSQRPLSGRAPLTGEGVITLYVDNVPPVPLIPDSKTLSPSAKVTLSYAGTYATLRQVAFADSSKSAFELTLNALPPSTPSGTSQASLRLQPSTSSSLAFVANFDIDMFDPGPEMSCVPAPCAAPSAGGSKITLKTTNLALSPISVASLRLYFGSMSTSLALISTDAAAKTTTLEATVPPFACVTCIHTNGAGSVPLALAYPATTANPITKTAFTFWREPRMISARFDPSGMQLEIVFDQATSAMPGQATCETLFSGGTAFIASLGQGARCVWLTPSKIRVFLGLKATVLPGDSLGISSTANVRSSNGISKASGASVRIGSALAPSKPLLSVIGTTQVDQCGNLEIRAAVTSAREDSVIYTWRCTNDEELDRYLRTLTGRIFASGAGTPELTTSDKQYIITCQATDFLGGVSDVATAEVLKSSLPLPQVVFTPPSVSITRNQEALVLAEAFFSSCPVDDTSSLSFAWEQTSGPSQIPGISATTIPQLRIAPNVLQAGGVYKLKLTVSMPGIASSSGELVISAGYQTLFATISGGSGIVASSSSPTSLSALGSRDPEVPAGEPQNLAYSWRCSMFDGFRFSACRDSSGKLLDLSSSTPGLVTVPSGLVPTQEQPYLFTVTVSKDTRLAEYSMPVTVLGASFSPVQLEVVQGARQRADGVFVANSGSKLVFRASSLAATAPTLSWSVEPPLAGLTTVDAATVSLTAELLPGISYTVSVSDAGGGISTAVVTANTAPSGGRFTACRIAELGASGSEGPATCETGGEPLIDTFRLEMSGWSDPDGPLLYQFGYSIEASSLSNATKPVWFDRQPAEFTDIEFPTGRIVVHARVFDVFAAESPIENASLLVGGPLAGGFRRASAAEMFARAKSKMSSDLKAFRATRVNRLASGLGLEGSKKLSPSEANALRGELMVSISQGSAMAVPTGGFACETYDAAASIAGSVDLMTSTGAASTGGLYASLSESGSGGSSGIDAQCSGSALSVLGAAMLGMYRGTVSLEAGSAQDGFMEGTQAGLAAIMVGSMAGAVAGEASRVLSSGGSSISVSRLAASGARRSLFGGSFTAANPIGPGSATFALPTWLGDDVHSAMTSGGGIDVAVQTHTYAPGADLKVRSALYGLSLFNVAGGGEAKVQGLAESAPIRFVIPVDTSEMTEFKAMLWPRRARCTFWRNDSYTTEGCAVAGVTRTSVTCECVHLTTFAIAEDTKTDVCGDGWVRPGEQCDDINIEGGDGCSADCQLETPTSDWECFSEPTLCLRRQADGSLRAQTRFSPFLRERGVQFQMSMTGFSSESVYRQHTRNVLQSLASTMGNGLDVTRATVIDQCFGGDCNTFFSDGSKIKARRSSSSLRPSTSRRSATSSFTVHVLPPEDPSAGNITSMLSAASSPTFAADFASSLSRLTGPFPLP